MEFIKQKIILEKINSERVQDDYESVHHFDIDSTEVEVLHFSVRLKLSYIEKNTDLVVAKNLVKLMEA